MNSKTIFAVLVAAFLVIFLLKDWTGCTRFTQVSNIDSLTAVHAEEMLAKDVQLTALQWEIRDLNMARRWDSVLLHKQDKALKGSNEKLKEVIAAYEQVRTLENCDTVIVYAEDLSDKVDSLQELLPHYQQTIDELVQVYDEALNAANDKALKEAQFSAQMRQAARTLTDENNRLKLSIRSKKRNTRSAIILAGVAGIAAGIFISK